MSDEKRMQLLKLSLNIFGAIFIVGIYLMMNWVWPSGWGWEPRQPEYEQMIMGVYATLGIFLVAIVLWYLLPKNQDASA